MIYENEKIWFQLKRLFKLFVFILLIFLYLLYLCQIDMFHYLIHKGDFEVIEAEIIDLDMTVEKVLRGKRYSYYVEVQGVDNSEQTYRIFRDVNDFVGKKVNIAINKKNPNDIYRAEWIRPKDGIWILTCAMGWVLCLLSFGKVLSYFKLKRVFDRIDREYMSEVAKKRVYFSDVNVNEKDAVVVQIKRDANPNITMETSQIYCRLTQSDEIVKSPMMLGHTFLKKGDYIKLDNSAENDINWGQYFI